MFGRILSLIFAAAMAGLLLGLFVINRHEIELMLFPFDPIVSIKVRLFIFMFALLFAGVLLGGAATWLTQGKWRRTARQRTQEAMRWKSEAERLARERDANVIERKQLALAE